MNTIITTPNVPLPAGAVWGDDWQVGPDRHRVVFGARRGITDHPVTVRTTAIQRIDGSVDTSPVRRVDAPHIVISNADRDGGLNSDQARELARLLWAYGLVPTEPQIVAPEAGDMAEKLERP